MPALRSFNSTASPSCNRCVGEMALANVIGRFGSQPELHVYRCSECDQFVFCTHQNGDWQKWAQR